jgi:hypothetical protein
MQPTKSNKALYWVIAIIVLILLLVWASRGNNTVDNVDNAGQNSTSTGANGSGGTNTGANGTSVNPGTGVNPPAIPNDATLLQIMGNSKVRAPQSGTDVALSNGQASYTSGSTRGQVALGSILAKVTTNDGYDVFVKMTLTTTEAAGKVTVENYVALFHVKGNTATYTSATLIGVGLPVQSVEAKRDPSVTTPNSSYPYMDSTTGYLLVVSYLDRKNGEPMTTAPTVLKDFTAHVKNHNISR